MQPMIHASLPLRLGALLWSGMLGGRIPGGVVN